MNMDTFRRKQLFKRDRELFLNLINKEGSDLNTEEEQLILELKAENQILETSKRIMLENDLLSYFNSISSSEISFELLTTYKCNCSCDYCYQKTSQYDSEKKEKMSMTLDHIDGIEKFYKECLNIELKDYNLTIGIGGGEVFVNDEEWNVAQYAMDKWENAKFNILTNGINVNKYLSRIQPDKVNKFQVSIDGPELIHNKRRPLKNGENSYSSILANVKTLVQSGFNTTVAVTADEESINYLPEIIRTFKALGILGHTNFSVQISAVFDNENLDSELQQYQRAMTTEMMFLDICKSDELVKNNVENRFNTPATQLVNLLKRPSNKKMLPSIYKCSRMQNPNFSFSPSGKVYICTQLIGKKEAFLGTYYPKASVNSDLIFKLKERSIKNLEQCWKCSFRFVCAGGCLVNSLAVKNDLFAPFCGQFTSDELEKHIQYMYLNS